MPPFLEISISGFLGIILWSHTWNLGVQSMLNQLSSCSSMSLLNDMSTKPVAWWPLLSLLATVYIRDISSRICDKTIDITKLKWRIWAFKHCISMFCRYFKSEVYKTTVGQMRQKERELWSMNSHLFNWCLHLLVIPMAQDNRDDIISMWHLHMSLR